MPAKKTQSHSSHQVGFKRRLGFVAALLVLYGLGLTARLVYLQVLRHDNLMAQSEKQYVRTIKLSTGRGKIFDRNHNLLASNLDVESVYVRPQDVFDAEETTRVLSQALGVNEQSIRRKLDSGKQFVWIKRKAASPKVAPVKEAELPGIGFVEESKRFYPKRELAASTLGFVGLDNQGLAGVEHYHHELLKGESYRQLVERDARGRRLFNPEDFTEESAVSREVVLTLDEVIQFFAEEALDSQIKKYKAKSGLVLVMQPYSGEILALATSPRFNPNHYSAYEPARWANPAISHAFEPGSIFKPIVAAAALEEGVAKPDDIFFCENGKFRLGKTSIGEASGHSFGWLSMKNIIVKSSNIGAIKIAQKLGEKASYKHIRNFGFGSKTGIDLPGEAKGSLRKLDDWSGLSLASVSFGHEISTTPIQMATAMSAIANGGTLVRPQITRSIMEGGREIKSFKPDLMRRVLSAKTSRQIVDIMKAVVVEGTGKKAAVPGFDVAGKTGTAQKIDPKTRRYSSTAFLSSFIGFVPAHAPKLVILVMIDEPQVSYWGGVVAAPVFSKVASQTLRYLNIPSAKERVFIMDRA